MVLTSTHRFTPGPPTSETGSLKPAEDVSNLYLYLVMISLILPSEMNNELIKDFASNNLTTFQTLPYLNREKQRAEDIQFWLSRSK